MEKLLKAKQKQIKTNKLSSKQIKILQIICLLAKKCLTLQSNLKRTTMTTSKNLLNAIIIIRLRQVVGSDRACL
jgi:hypothetical protein